MHTKTSKSLTGCSKVFVQTFAPSTMSLFQRIEIDSWLVVNRGKKMGNEISHHRQKPFVPLNFQTENRLNKIIHQPSNILRRSSLSERLWPWDSLWSSIACPVPISPVTWPSYWEDFCREGMCGRILGCPLFCDGRTLVNQIWLYKNPL